MNFNNLINISKTLINYIYSINSIDQNNLINSIDPLYQIKLIDSDISCSDILNQIILIINFNNQIKINSSNDILYCEYMSNDMLNDMSNEIICIKFAFSYVNNIINIYYLSDIKHINNIKCMKYVQYFLTNLFNGFEILFGNIEFGKLKTIIINNLIDKSTDDFIKSNNNLSNKSTDDFIKSNNNFINAFIKLTIIIKTQIIYNNIINNIIIDYPTHQDIQIINLLITNIIQITNCETIILTYILECLCQMSQINIFADIIIEHPKILLFMDKLIKFKLHKSYVLFANLLDSNFENEHRIIKKLSNIEHINWLKNQLMHISSYINIDNIRIIKQLLHDKQTKIINKYYQLCDHNNIY